MKKIAIVLSGCGYKEGTEITEAVSAMTTLSRLGAEIQCFSPAPVIEESNKIARDTTKNISELNSKDFDALVFPGGFGAAKVLCNWAEAGSGCSVNPQVESAIKSFYEDSSPIGALCIAPVLLAKVLGDKGVAVTIGNDKETATEIEKTGAQHVECTVDDFVTDRENKIVTSPAYMFGDAKPGEVFTGVEKAMRELFEMA
jgi:enhancing lycopene biosynthesis protein 2